MRAIPQLVSAPSNPIPIAFMRDDIIQAKITTKPRFENVNFRFYHELISKAAMMKRIPEIMSRK